MSGSMIAYVLILVLLAILLVLMALIHGRSSESRHYAKPHSAIEIIERAKSYRLTGTAQALRQLDGGAAGPLEQEVRRFAALLAINSGEQFQMSSKMQSAWSCLVNEHKEYARFCEHLLGAGGGFTRTRVPRSANLDIAASKAKFVEAYEAAFGCQPEPTIWECNRPTQGTSDDDYVFVAADQGKYKKVLQKDGEFVDCFHGSSMDR